MTKPHFTWTVTYNNDSTVSQYTGDTETGVFGPDVEDEMATENVKKFRLEAEDGEYYEANLVNGTVDLNGDSEINIIMDIAGDRPTLIYKRTNNVRTIIGTGAIQSPKTTFKIGVEQGNKNTSAIIFPGLGLASRSAQVIYDEDDGEGEQNSEIPYPGS